MNKKKKHIVIIESERDLYDVYPSKHYVEGLGFLPVRIVRWSEATDSGRNRAIRRLTNKGLSHSDARELVDLAIIAREGVELMSDALRNAVAAYKHGDLEETQKQLRVAWDVEVRIFEEDRLTDDVQKQMGL